MERTFHGCHRLGESLPALPEGQVHRHVHIPQQHILVPTRCHIQMDLVGPLPPSKGFTRLFTVMNRTSHWPEAIHIAATSTTCFVNALFQKKVSRFGVPAVIKSDRVPQFTSSLWAALCDLLNIQHAQMAAYNLQSNGMVERFHHHLKNDLRARCAMTNRLDHLPWVLLGLHTAQAVFGSPLIFLANF
jgi:hypothetical protein